MAQYWTTVVSVLRSCYFELFADGITFIVLLVSRAISYILINRSDDCMCIYDVLWSSGLSWFIKRISSLLLLLYRNIRSSRWSRCLLASSCTSEESSRHVRSNCSIKYTTPVNHRLAVVLSESERMSCCLTDVTLFSSLCNVENSKSQFVISVFICSSLYMASQTNQWQFSILSYWYYLAIHLFIAAVIKFLCECFISHTSYYTVTICIHYSFIRHGMSERRPHTA